MTPPKQRLALGINWPLTLGALLVLGVLFIAVFGPQLAPRDPQAGSLVAKVGDKFVTAPFAPFTVPGFPLGSDERGRDLVSLLLWAVRPTLLLVALVTATRLGLGLLIGLTSGWSTTWIGRGLDTLISGALAAPVLIVSLAVIAVLGVEPGQGVQTFVFGLALTGWAETARAVREQTRAQRGQPYVEAARALGASDSMLLTRHVLPHVLPLLWVLAAFEVSSALLTVAGLGFLGYYTNDTWVQITDTTAQRFSNLPELGQMLATVTTDILTGPWKMFAAGSMVFITVLGFNLLGTGLRQQLNVQRVRQRTWMTVVRERTGVWAETAGARRLAWAGLVAVVTMLAYTGFMTWQSSQAAPAVTTPIVQLAVPGQHLWATERHDPSGTLWVDVKGPDQTAHIAWAIQRPTGFSGGPAIAADGTLYLAANDALVAFDATGQMLWEAPLTVPPVGAPALDAAGNIYLAASDGGLMSFDSAGGAKWRMLPTSNLGATGSPIVAPDGNIYYTVAGKIQAVSAEGQPLWLVDAFTRRVTGPPRLSPDGDLVFLRNGMLNTATGEKLDPNFPIHPDQLLVGGDGQLYSRVEASLSRWQMVENVVEIVQAYPWQSGGSAFGMPTDAGAMNDGTLWINYSPEFQDARFVWLAADAKLLNAIRFPHRPSRVIALDQQNIAYFCGQRGGFQPECRAYGVDSENPVWTVPLDQGGVTVNGGALIANRLYVTLAEGTFYAIEGQP